MVPQIYILNIISYKGTVFSNEVYQLEQNLTLNMVTFNIEITYIHVYSKSGTVTLTLFISMRHFI